MSPCPKGTIHPQGAACDDGWRESQSNFMKNFVRGCGMVIAVGWMVAEALPGRAADPDFALIQKLPEREIAAKKTAHEGWDSGARTKMLAATDAYNDALTGMVTDLAAAYYGKAKVTKEEVAAYVKTLRAAAEFRHRLDNPTNELPDAMDALEAPSVVSNDLEDTVEQMVGAVSGDDEKFDYPAWEKRWEDAKKTGDKPEETVPMGKKAGDKPEEVLPTGKAATDTKGAPTEKRDKPD